MNVALLSPIYLYCLLPFTVGILLRNRRCVFANSYGFRLKIKKQEAVERLFLLFVLILPPLYIHAITCYRVYDSFLLF